MKFQEVALNQLHEGKDKIEESLRKSEESLIQNVTGRSAQKTKHRQTFISMRSRFSCLI